MPKCLLDDVADPILAFMTELGKIFEDTAAGIYTQYSIHSGLFAMKAFVGLPLFNIKLEGNKISLSYGYCCKYFNLVEPDSLDLLIKSGQEIIRNGH